MPRRLALLIANSEYQDAQLKRLRTPTADAERLAQVLKDPAIGDFEVSLLVNRPLLEVRRAIAQHFQRKTRDDLLLLYYSGHGIKPDYGELFLAVHDTEKELLEATALDAAYVRGLIDRSNSQRNVVLLDCCHSGAFGGGAKNLGVSAGAGDAFGGNGYGRVILTASNALEYAWEGEQLVGEAELSVFTRYLVEGLQTGAADRDGDGEVALDELYDYVYGRVIGEGKARQTPQKWAQKVEGRIVIARNPQPPDPRMALPKELQEDIRSPLPWRRQGAVVELARLLAGPDKRLVMVARAALEDLRDDDSRQVATAAASVLGSATNAPAAPPRVESKPIVIEKPAPPSRPDVLTISRPLAMEFRRVPAGEFLMGSDPTRDKEAYAHEQPQHRVYVSEFYIARYPVTQRQYAAFVQAAKHESQGGWNGVPTGGDDHPVVRVSWNDAAAFCKWLSESSGLAARLPTEAEWEKAARGADGRIYPWGDAWDAKKANVKGSGPGGTTPVGQYSPDGDSPYAAADMAGNVWEWCADRWDERLYKSRASYVEKDPVGPQSGQARVLRGGSWNNEPKYARCGARNYGDPYLWGGDGGFRVACGPPSSDL